MLSKIEPEQTIADDVLVDAKPACVALVPVILAYYALSEALSTR